MATLVIELALLASRALWRHPLCPGPSQATTLAGTEAIYLVAVATATILPLACPRVLAETTTSRPPARTCIEAQLHTGCRLGRVRAVGRANDAAGNGKWAARGSAQSTGCLRLGRTRRGAATSLKTLPQVAHLPRAAALR